MQGSGDRFNDLITRPLNRTKAAEPQQPSLRETFAPRRSFFDDRCPFPEPVSGTRAAPPARNRLQQRASHRQVWSLAASGQAAGMSGERASGRRFHQHGMETAS